MRKDRWNLAIFILLCDKSHHARFHDAKDSRYKLLLKFLA
jgi:hypothetical protein